MTVEEAAIPCSLRKGFTVQESNRSSKQADNPYTQRVRSICYKDNRFRLLNHALISTQVVTVGRLWIMNQDGCGRKRSCPILRYYSTNLWKELRKIMTLNAIVGCRVLFEPGTFLMRTTWDVITLTHTVEWEALLPSLISILSQMNPVHSFNHISLRLILRLSPINA
jgi:hypothetical protein